MYPVAIVQMHGYGPFGDVAQRKTADPRVEWQSKLHPKRLFFECGNNKKHCGARSRQKFVADFEGFLGDTLLAGFDSCAGSFTLLRQV